jgi:hypothetical protein
MREHADRSDPDYRDQACKGDARMVLSDGGPRFTYRAWLPWWGQIEHRMSAQNHRFKKAAEVRVARETWGQIEP